MSRLCKFVRAWPFLACGVVAALATYGALYGLQWLILLPVRADLKAIEQRLDRIIVDSVDTDVVHARQLHTLEGDARTIYGWLAEIETKLEGE